MQQHPAVAVQGDQKITQLRPGEDHHGQVAAGQGQTAAQFTGGDAFRRGGGLGAAQGQCPQCQNPVQQRGHGKANDVRKFGVSLPDVGADRGEHFLRHQHGHGDALMVVHDGFGRTDDLTAPNIHIQIRGNGRLAVDAGEGGIVAHGACGHGNGKAQAFHGIVKAAQQRQVQLEFFLIVDLDNLHHFGDRILKAHCGFAHVALTDFADVHISSRFAFGRGYGRVVHGDVFCVGRQWESEFVQSRFQTQCNVHGDKAVAVGSDGAQHIHF